MIRKILFYSIPVLALTILCFSGFADLTVKADKGGARMQLTTTPQTLPFSQNWTNTGLITANDDWSGVPGITLAQEWGEEFDIPVGVYNMHF
jgi:hypothetical protein